MNWLDDLRRLLERVRRETPPNELSDEISCEETAERIFEWLDGELDTEWEHKVGRHLEDCARCYPRLVFERSFLEALNRVSDEETTPEELRDRILRSLEEEGFTAS